MDRRIPLCIHLSAFDAITMNPLKTTRYLCSPFAEETSGKHYISDPINIAIFISNSASR